MESVLHIEPIARQAPAPLNIGHSDLVFYGNNLTVDDENVGQVSSRLSLGSPLDGMDYGHGTQCVPLVKTVEYAPDWSRPEGNVYLETTHLVKDKSYLIPFRTRLRGGTGFNIRLNHLPSLNLARRELTPFAQEVVDPRSSIVNNVLLLDDVFRRRKNQTLRDWLMYELGPALDHKHYTSMSFDVKDVNSIIPRYVDQVRDTPSEYTRRDLKSITESICPLLGDEERYLPSSLFSPNPQAIAIQDVRHRLMVNPFDFRSWGSIPFQKLPRILYNPKKFQEICERLDYLPLTDLNVDLVLDVNNQVIFQQFHLAVNRFGLLSDVDMGLYNPEEIFDDYIDRGFLTDVVDKFYETYALPDPELAEIFFTQSVKLKLMKTMSDEAAVLVYKYDSAPNDPPLCGVYFDIALQSLAPTSIMPFELPN